jgi:cell division transport system permease protein
MVDSAEESIAVTVFFQEGTSDETIKAIGKKIESRPEVASYKFVSAEEAWETAKKDFFKGNDEVAKSLAERKRIGSSDEDDMVIYLDKNNNISINRDNNVLRKQFNL